MNIKKTLNVDKEKDISMIKRDQVIAVPTETVYRIATDARDVNVAP